MRYPKWRSILPTETFLEDRVNIREIGAVVVVRQSVRAHDSEQFRLSLFAYLRMERHCQEERLESGDRLETIRIELPRLGPTHSLYQLRLQVNACKILNARHRDRGDREHTPA